MPHAIHIDNADDDIRITGNTVFTHSSITASTAAVLVDVDDILVRKVEISSNFVHCEQGFGIRYEGDTNLLTIADNVVNGSEEDGISVDMRGVFTAHIAGNSVRNACNGGADANRGGIRLIGSGTEAIGPAGRNRHVHSNLVTNSFLHGIVLEDLEHGDVHDNTVERVRGQGILIVDSSQCNVHNNTVQYVSEATTTNTTDAIHLSGDSDINQVVSNRVTNTQAGTIRLWRYGVNISAATCDDNIVADNVLFPAAGFGTGAYNDAGTGTITTRDANGQFT